MEFGTPEYAEGLSCNRDAMVRAAFVEFVTEMERATSNMLDEWPVGHECEAEKRTNIRCKDRVGKVKDFLYYIKEQLGDFDSELCKRIVNADTGFMYSIMAYHNRTQMGGLVLISSSQDELSYMVWQVGLLAGYLLGIADKESLDPSFQALSGMLDDIPGLDDFNARS